MQQHRKTTHTWFLVGSLLLVMLITVLGWPMPNRLAVWLNPATAQAQTSDETARLRALYDDPLRFEQLSGAGRTLLESKFGKKPAPSATTPSGRAAAAPNAPASSGGVLVNNNTGATGTSFFTQSETTLVLGAGTNVIASFNDSGSRNGANKFTGFARSTDMGSTWTDGETLPTNATGDAGDPVLARDNVSGRVYLSTLQFSGDGIAVFRSDDDAATWMVPTQGAPGKIGFQDKEWIAVDNFGGPGQGNVYLMARDFGPGDGIYFFRSTDQGATFGPSGGTLIASGGAGNVQGAFVAVGPDHSVYAFFFNQPAASIQVRRSTDQGLTFGPPVTLVSGLAGPGPFNGNLGLTGKRQGTMSFAPFRSNSFPHAAVNPVSGHVYVVFNDNPAGVDKGDAFMVMSTDLGATWSARVRLNTDATTTDQWVPTIGVTPDGTRLMVAWYDRRSDPAENNLIERWARIGVISGATVTFGGDFCIGPQFLPEFGRDSVVNSTYMGDYDQIVADNSFFYGTWGDQPDDLAGGAGRKDPNVRFAKIAVNTCPTITINPASLPSGQFGVVYNQLLVGSGGTAPYTFALQAGSSLPAGLTLNGTTGNITGTPTAPGATTFTIIAIDTNGCTGNQTYTVGIQCPVIGVNPAPSLPNPQAGVPYSQTLTGSGGVGPYTFALHVGSVLPPGLTLVGATISGTPTTLGVFTFTIDVTDTGLPIGMGFCGGNRTYTVTVVCPPITLSPGTLPNGVQGTAYNQSVTAAPATLTYSYAVTTNILPPGLSLNPATGAITGTPSAPGNYTFVITATALGVCTGSRSYNVLITGTCAPITLNPATLPGGTLGTAYPATTVSASGGVAPYTFSVVAGALPPGLTLDANTGVISGTPTAGGSYTPTIRATGQGGCTGQRLYVISVVCAAITINPPTLPAATVGITYSQQLTANIAGTFSLQLGSLPPGFTLSSAGLLSGVTSQAGSYNFTVKVMAGSCTGTRAYTLVVNAGAMPIRPALAQSGDYDGDGKTDPALWTADTGRWNIMRSSDQHTISQTWGTLGDLSLLGDYDGDGKSDLAVFRPSEGNWYVRHSSNGSFNVKAWGVATDIPAPGDYDGDGKTDLAVFRPSEGNWYVLRSSDDQYAVTVWGAGAAPYLDVPVPGDYDGDGKTDLAVFRRATGTWLVKRSGDGQVLAKAWGVASDVPVAGDYDGDGQADLAVWRGATGVWYIWQSTTNSYRMAAWGIGQAPYLDQTAPGDYDGDGQADLAVWRTLDQTWYIQCSLNGSLMTRTQGQVGDALAGKSR